jgi:hypothetical protein
MKPVYHIFQRRGITFLLNSQKESGTKFINNFKQERARQKTNLVISRDEEAYCIFTLNYVFKIVFG